VRFLQSPTAEKGVFQAKKKKIEWKSSVQKKGECCAHRWELASALQARLLKEQLVEQGVFQKLVCTSDAGKA
jgi:hypothetical protein